MREQLRRHDGPHDERAALDRDLGGQRRSVIPRDRDGVRRDGQRIDRGVENERQRAVEGYLGRRRREQPGALGSAARGQEACQPDETKRSDQ